VISLEEHQRKLIRAFQNGVSLGLAASQLDREIDETPVDFMRPRSVVDAERHLRIVPTDPETAEIFNLPYDAA
jgi:hypothetical protein